MSELLNLIEAWLTAFNVQMPGGKPFHLNMVKTALLVFCGGLLLWIAGWRSSEQPLHRFVRWCESRAVNFYIALMSSLLMVGLSYLTVAQFYAFTGQTFDLAIYSNTIWNTLHGRWFFDSISNGHRLGDHFAPILAAFAPLYALWDSPIWLLLIQAVATGLGAVALGLMAYRATNQAVATFMLLLVYASNPYLHSAMAHNFHPIFLAIPIFLWLLYALDRHHPWSIWIACGLAMVALLVEESLPPGLVGIGLYLMLFRPEYRKLGVVFVISGAVWFLIEVSVWIPHFSQCGGLCHWHRYENLGPDVRSALVRLATDPFFLVSEALLQHHKYYYLLALLFSVGFLPLLAWREATLIILPAFFMLLSGNGGQYKFGFHYSAVVLPFLFYSTIHGMARLSNLKHMVAGRITIRLPAAVLLVLLFANIYQVKWSNLSHINADHIQIIEDTLRMIPNQASLRVDGRFVARVSSRHQITVVSDDTDANFNWWTPDYFLLDTSDEGGTPASVLVRKALRDVLLNEHHYQIVLQRDGVTLLHRDKL